MSKKIYYCHSELSSFGSPLILFNINEGVFLDHYEVLLREDDWLS